MRRPSSSAARLADVARRAKVSLNTASRALTGKPDVNPETRERVRRVAEELDYRPNFLARSLVGGRTHIVGLVVTDCTDPFYAALIRAVEATATRRGYALLLATSNEDSAKEKQALAVLRERRVDGLLLTAVDAEAPHVRQLTRTDLPIVLVARRAASYRGHYVGNDNIEAATMATRHLIELGHQRMAYIDRTGTASSAVERMVGYRRELLRARLRCDPKLICRVAATVDGGREAAAWFMRLKPRPSAVATFNDAQAIGFMAALRELGLEVPGDVSVIGDDDIGASSLVRPALTTVAQPIAEIGSLSTELLIDSIEGEADRARTIMLPPKLVVRASTGPAQPGGAARPRSMRADKA